MSMRRRISGGGKATVRVYLQRYLDGLVPGHDEIPWEFQASCADDKLTPAGFVSGRGLIRLDIVAARGALPTIFEQYIQKVRSAPDATTRNEAAEALVSSRSPEVIPYLKQVAALGEVTVAFNGLIKFKGNSLAREFVLEGLQSGKATEETDSLRVLTEWRERLSNAELERLLQNNRTRSAVLHYIGLIQDTDRLPLVEQYTDNPDPYVAKVAREARTALLNQGSVRRGGRGADQKP